MYRIVNIESGEVENWPEEAVLNEINRDRGPEWIDYDKFDIQEGWDVWVEGESYHMIGSSGDSSWNILKNRDYRASEL